MGMGMLLFSLEPVVNKLSPTTFLINEATIFVIAFVYMGWALGQFYGKSLKAYLHAFLAYLFGMVTFQVIAVAIDLLYDIATRN